MLALRSFCFLQNFSPIFWRGAVWGCWSAYDSTPEWLKSSLVKAILDGKFSDYPEVLNVLIGKLHVFTRKAAQYTLSIAILFQKFGDKTDVLTALAQNLHVFTYTHAQKIVAETLCAGRLGDPELVLKALRQNLLACTDSKAREVLQKIINFTYLRPGSVLAPHAATPELGC